MADRTPVELVRVEREEEYFEREEVLGRDAASVFPTEAKKAALDPEALKSIIGGDRKFISATELEEIKKKRGLSVEDGTLAPSKPLAEILREAKEKKQQEFEEHWKQMKQGKNRPLDEDEMEFLDSVANAAAEQERAVRQQEAEELAAFQEALRQQQEAKAAEEAAKAAAAHKLQAGAQHKRPHPPVKPRAKPAVVIVKQASSDRAGGQGTQQPSGSIERDPGSNDAAAGGPPASKRQRADEKGAGAGGAAELAGATRQQQQQSGALQEEEIGLPGLLGGYGSGSDDGSD